MELRLQNIITPFLKMRELTISRSEKVLIKGPSGTGKTTLLHLLAGLYTPQSGEVLWDGNSITHLSENQLSQLRRKNLSLIFQNLNLLPYLTAGENLELVGLSSQEAASLLSAVGLKEKFFSRTQSMSLGEQQRTAVARALGQKTTVIMADEPTSSLDDKNTEQVMRLLTESSHKPNLIVVSHDHRIEKYFDRILDMKEIAP